MNFLDKYLPILGAIALIVGYSIIVNAAYNDGYNAAKNHYQKLMAEADKAHAIVYAQLEANARQQEQDHAATIAAVDQKYFKELKNVQAKNKADLAALRNGALQLRDRFICPDAGGSRPSTLTGSGMGNGTGTGGLRITDAEFLVSEADRADGIVIQLQACQEILRADRSLGGNNER